VAHYVWQYPNWTDRLRWDTDAVLTRCPRLAVGKGCSWAARRGSGWSSGARYTCTLTDEAVTTSDRGREARPRLSALLGGSSTGLETAGMPRSDRRADALVEVLLDARRASTNLSPPTA